MPSECAEPTLEAFFDHVLHELEDYPALGADLGGETFGGYYRWMFTRGARKLPEAKRTWVRRLLPAANIVAAAPRGLRVLDCGCGMGTEAIALASLGARVTGVDLSPKRIGIARERSSRIADALGTSIDTTFQCVSLWDLTDRGEYDLALCREAISHIHPPRRFVELMHAVLKPDGRLVISDPNALCPLVQAKLFRHRGFRAVHTTTDPSTGQPIAYANERVISIPGVRRLLKGAGFRIESEVRENHLQSAAGTPLYPVIAALSSVVEAVPPLSLLCTHYTIVARSAAEAQTA